MAGFVLELLAYLVFPGLLFSVNAGILLSVGARYGAALARGARPAPVDALAWSGHALAVGARDSLDRLPAAAIAPLGALVFGALAATALLRQAFGPGAAHWGNLLVVAGYLAAASLLLAAASPDPRRRHNDLTTAGIYLVLFFVTLATRALTAGTLAVDEALAAPAWWELTPPRASGLLVMLPAFAVLQAQLRLALGQYEATVADGATPPAVVTAVLAAHAVLVFSWTCVSAGLFFGGVQPTALGFVSFALRVLVLVAATAALAGLRRGPVTMPLVDRWLARYWAVFGALAVAALMLAVAGS